MPRLRTFLIPPLVALAGTGFAMAVAQDGGGGRTVPAKNKVSAPAPIRPNPARLAKLLKDWEGQSAKLKTLDVSIYRIDLAPAWGDEDHYEGHAVFSRPQLAYLDFRKVKLVPDSKKKLVPQVDRNKKRVTTAFERIICTQNEVWQYRFDNQQIFVFPLDKNARKRRGRRGAAPFPFRYEGQRSRGALRHGAVGGRRKENSP